MNKSMTLLAAGAAAALALCLPPSTVLAADAQAATPAPEAKAAPAQPAEVKPAEAPPAATDGKPAEPAKAAAAEPKKEISPNAPVVLVNGKPIAKAEYDRALGAYLQTLQQAAGGMHGKVDAANDTMKEEVIGQLVDRELLYQESQKFLIEDLAAKADEEIKGIQGRFPSPEAFQEALKAQSLTEGDLKDLVGRQLSVRTYVEKQLEPTATVPEEDVKKFFEDNKERFVTPEQVKASHLLIRLPEGAKPEDEAYKTAKGKAQELQKKAAAPGADFAALCKENSEDPGSKDDGGDLGFFTKDRMVEPFAKAAFAMQVNQVSDVVETQFGFHVIKLLERKDAVHHGYDEVKGDISAYLKGQALDRAVQAKIAELKKAAKVEVVGPHL